MNTLVLEVLRLLVFQHLTVRLLYLLELFLLTLMQVEEILQLTLIFDQSQQEQEL